jgi:uncharacterized membrane protein YbhN (UPF0104 family)
VYCNFRGQFAGLTKSTKIILRSVFGILFLFLTAYVIYRQILLQPDYVTRLQAITISWQHPFIWLALFLMPLNWGLETLKWKRLMKPLEALSFFNAFKAVLAGCSITMFTPNRIGEYGGRMLYIQPKNRIASVSVTMLGGLNQLIVTCWMGLLALPFFYSQVIFPSASPLQSWMQSLGWVVVLLASMVLTIAVFRISWISKKLSGIRLLEKPLRHLSVAAEYQPKQMLIVLMIACFRYLVFIFQYYLLLIAMGVDLSLSQGVPVLAVFYLLMTWAPTIGFTELPLRSVMAVWLIGLFSSNILGIQAASLIIWVFNLAIPAMLGSIIISFKKSKHALAAG